MRRKETGEGGRKGIGQKGRELTFGTWLLARPLMLCTACSNDGNLRQAGTYATESALGRERKKVCAARKGVTSKVTSARDYPKKNTET